MKRSLLLVFKFFIFSLCSELMAQNANEGIYLSANDFTKGKLAFENAPGETKYKLHLNEIFNSAVVKVTMQGSVIELKKDSIFGYRDMDNNCFRFYKNDAYKIINSTEKILLYSQTISVGSPRNIHFVTNYFFSENAGSAIYSLSKLNLKAVLYNDVRFHELLDIYFHSDDELTSYDSINKVYNINRIYDLSKQKSN
jgi:hypothetical protein